MLFRARQRDVYSPVFMREMMRMRSVLVFGTAADGLYNRSSVGLIGGKFE